MILCLSSNVDIQILLYMIFDDGGMGVRSIKTYDEDSKCYLTVIRRGGVKYVFHVCVLASRIYNVQDWVALMSKPIALFLRIWLVWLDWS